MKHYLLIAFLSLTTIAIAQPPRGGGNFRQAPSIKGRVIGRLLDADTNEPLAFASVVLRSPSQNKDINGTITDGDGNFKLTEVPVGKYELLISFVGYDLKKQTIELSPKKPDLNLSTITMKGNVAQLEEVVVQGERELIENKIDKIVYNAERDVANSGGDATDVLRRAPLLSVDLEGNVSLRGSQNIQILVNGKPSTMFASNPGDALKVIPADQIKSVEVITSPSAKYDGEGTAGIINIITKKASIQGIAGNIDMSVGTRSNRGVLGLNGGVGRFGFNASGSSFYSWPQTGETVFRREDMQSDQTRLLNEIGDARSNRLGFFGTAGAFYDFNAYHSLSTSFRLRGFTSNSEGTTLTNLDDNINNINQEFKRDTDNESLRNGFEWSMDYVMKFPEQQGRELSFSYQVDGNNSDQQLSILQNDLIGNDQNLFIDEFNDNDGKNRENTMQADYVHPVGKNMKFETGVKAVLRGVESGFRVDTLNLARGDYEIDRSRTDFLDYDQDVVAGYVSSNFKLGKKTGLLAGVRYERTDIQGELEVQEGSNFQNDYDNWLPSITFSYKTGKTSTAKASYNRRIQRPSLRFINPYQQINNTRNISQGNPELDPELTDNYEISYSTFSKGSSINISAYYRRTTDVIESFTELTDDNLSVSTFFNVGERNSVGMNIFTSTKLFKIWTLRGGVNVFTYDASGVVNGVAVSNNAVLWNGNINSNIKLKNGLIIDMFGFYRARRQTLQGFNPSFSIFSMGIRKPIWNDKGSIGIRIVEPFFENKSFISEIEGTNFNQFSEREIPFRS
ncbi:MAG: TonB-dependent receptor, partial [Bacteroidota bacterium]